MGSVTTNPWLISIINMTIVFGTKDPTVVVVQNGEYQVLEAK